MDLNSRLRWYMEPHLGKPEDFDRISWDASIEDLFEYASKYASKFHPVELDLYRSVRPDCIEPQKFWSEYVWTVYASGFNAKVLTNLYQDLISSVGPWNLWMSPVVLWSRVRKVIANRRKCESIHQCRTLIQDLGWPAFKEHYCSSVLAFKNLPFIGTITCNHLARNLGYDCVKPDIHLERLANHYEFGDSWLMCEFLSALYEERIGVVDFILWSYSAAFGTRELSC